MKVGLVWVESVSVGDNPIADHQQIATCDLWQLAFLVPNGHSNALKLPRFTGGQQGGRFNIVVQILAGGDIEDGFPSRHQVFVDGDMQNFGWGASDVLQMEREAVSIFSDYGKRYPWALGVHEGIGTVSSGGCGFFGSLCRLLSIPGLNFRNIGLSVDGEKLANGHDDIDKRETAHHPFAMAEKWQNCLLGLCLWGWQSVALFKALDCTSTVAVFGATGDGLLAVFLAGLLVGTSFC